MLAEGITTDYRALICHLNVSAIYICERPNGTFLANVLKFQQTLARRGFCLVNAEGAFTSRLSAMFREGPK